MPHHHDVGGICAENLSRTRRVASGLHEQQVAVVDMPLAIAFHFRIFHRALLLFAATLCTNGAHVIIALQFQTVFAGLKPFLP